MKKKFSLFAKSFFAITATTAIVGTTATTLASCSSKQKQDVNKVVQAHFNNFLLNTHGRWTGNISNYGIDNIELDSSGRHIGVKSNAKPLYDLSTSIESSVNNYGSHHAYLYIVEQLKNMGYQNLTSNVQYPTNAKIEETTGTNGTDKVVTVKPQDGSKLVQISTTRSVMISSNTSTTNLTKTGIMVQPFLWNGPDRASGASMTYNNLAQNIVATIANNNAKNDFYIVAHYDSTVSGPNKSSWGATDNATGVAVALAIADYFIKNPEELQTTRLHIMFSDAEEVGVLGSYAFVEQYLTSNASPTLNNIGMINLDTVAGGDYIYVHSPNTDPKLGTVTGNSSSIIRDQINALSRIRAVNHNDPNLELLIHPQISAGEYRAGETGDWSDHAPFYRKANIPVAYLESTNFQVKSNSGLYDGYSQTKNLNAFVLKDGSTLASKKVSLKETSINNSQLKVYDLPDAEGMNSYGNYLVSGNIWHSDLDTLSWVKQNIGSNIYSQLTTMFESLKLYLQTSLSSL